MRGKMVIYIYIYLNMIGNYMALVRLTQSKKAIQNAALLGGRHIVAITYLVVILTNLFVKRLFRWNTFKYFAAVHQQIWSLLSFNTMCNFNITHFCFTFGSILSHLQLLNAHLTRMHEIFSSCQSPGQSLQTPLL